MRDEESTYSKVNDETFDEKSFFEHKQDKTKTLRFFDVLLLILGILFILFAIAAIVAGVVKIIKVGKTDSLSKNQKLRERVVWGAAAVSGGFAMVAAFVGGASILLSNHRLLTVRQILSIIMLVLVLIVAALNAISITIMGIVEFKSSSKGHTARGIAWFAAGFGIVAALHGSIVVLLIIRLLVNKLWNK